MALTDNLVSYYKLDESSGNASDSVGSNTLTNNGTATYTTGKINNAATLVRSSSQYLDGGTTSSLQPASALTFSMWIKINNKPVSYCAIGGDTLSGQQRGYLFDMATVGNTLAFQIGNGTWGVVSTTYTTGVYIHIVGVWDGSTVTLYKNGVSVGTPVSKASITYTSSGFSLGRYYNDSTSANMFDGQIDEVGIWSRALTSTEVTELYNSGNGKQYPFGLAYTLAVELGQYTYSGVNFILKSARKMAVTTGAYVYTGIDYLFKLGKGMTITTGSYVYTGVNFTLKSARTMAITTGDYVYTGIDFLFQKGFGIVISTGQYIYTGINFILRSSNIWTNQSKNSSAFTNQSKNSSDWTNQNKS